MPAMLSVNIMVGRWMEMSMRHGIRQPLELRVALVQCLRLHNLPKLEPFCSRLFAGSAGLRGLFVQSRFRSSQTILTAKAIMQQFALRECGCVSAVREFGSLRLRGIR